MKLGKNIESEFESRERKIRDREKNCLLIGLVINIVQK